MADIPKIVKIFVSGEGGVGKTTLIKRYCTGQFFPNTLMTIGVEFAVKTLPHFDDITLQIWDLGGEDRFRFIVPNYVRGAYGGLLVFDLTRFLTFTNLEDWLNIIRKAVSDIPVILVGTKNDIADKRAVTKDAIEEYVAATPEITCYVETSSKTGHNIDTLFDTLVKKMFPAKFDAQV